MAKGSKTLALGFLLLPLLYALFFLLRSDISPVHHWKLQLSHWPSSSSLSIMSEASGVDDGSRIRFLLRRLVQGRARRELSQNGATCISDPESNICVISDAVRITAGSLSSVTVHLTAGQRLLVGSNFTVRPYARKKDDMAMLRTSPVRFVSGGGDPPPCDVTHSVPAVVFSTGGFAGNFFHDINDVIIPLFITSGHFRTRVRLVVTDFESWWVAKYRHVLAHLSSDDVVVASSPSSAVDSKVHCFPGAVVGLKYHDNLACNSADVPGSVSIVDFRRFLHKSFRLKWRAVGDDAGGKDRPLLVLISRRKSRTLLNEDGVVQLAEEMGFRVEVAPPRRMSKVREFAELVNSCTVLVGVHGAGLTNMVFLRQGAVLLQVVPWGLDWASKTYYARPAQQMELNYVEYKSAVEESTLYEEYPRNHPVLTDPWSIHLQGYNVSKPVYTDGQSLRLDLSRFRETLLQAKQFFPNPTF